MNIAPQRVDGRHCIGIAIRPIKLAKAVSRSLNLAKPVDLGVRVAQLVE
jgi:hypothetical protein